MAFRQNSRGGGGGDRGRGGFRGSRGGGGRGGGRGRSGSVGFGNRGGDRGGSRGGSWGGSRGGSRGGGRGDSRGGSRGGSRDGDRGKFGGGQDRGRGGRPSGGRPFETNREFSSNSIYVGQLPADIQDSDLKKLFPKATTVQITPAAGPRPGHAFLTFADDSSATAAVKQGATFKNTHLKVAFQNKRAEPQKRSSDVDDKSGPKAKKLKSDAFAGKGSANNNGSKAKGKPGAGSDDDEDDDDDDEESMDFEDEDDDEDDDDDEGESDEDGEKNLKKTVAKMVPAGKLGKVAAKPSAGKNVEEDDDDDDDDDDDEDDDDDDDEDDDDEEEDEQPTKSQKTPPSSAKQVTPTSGQNQTKVKPDIKKPAVIDNSLQNKNKPTSVETQKRPVEVVDKSGPQAKKLKNETPAGGKNSPAGNKNGLQVKGKQVEEEDEDDDDDESDEELDFGEDDDDEDDDDEDDDDDDDDDDDKETPKTPVGKSLVTGKQAKLTTKAPVVEDDDEDEFDDDDEDDDDDDDEEEDQKPTKITTKPTPASKQAKPAAKPSAVEDDEDDDDDDDEDDDDEAFTPPTPLKSALKQPASTPSKQKPSATPTKSETKPTQNAKQPTPPANKTLNKTQLFINSIKESVSVADVKSLYPKATSVKMQKRKVGPNKAIQFAFVSFADESDCAEALSAHTQIGGEKVNISYAFAQTNKQQQPKQANTNNKQEQKSTNTNKNQPKQTPTNENSNKKEKIKSVKQLSTNAIYVGQFPEHVVEDDVKKLFPKANKIELFPAKATNKGVRPGFAFVTFPDDNSAAAAIKLGPSLTLKNTQLKVAYQTKRATPITAE